MRFAWFAFIHDPDDASLQVSDADFRFVCEVVRSTPGLSKGLVFTPWAVGGLYFDDGVAPQLALELYFEDIRDLEAALAPDGHLHALAAPDALPSLAGAACEQQAMLARAFPVPDPEFRTPPGEPWCTYLVHYPGEAEDVAAWLAHYLANHTRIMATFPAIREVEVCSRIDWCGALPWRRIDHMQRNKVVFDDGAALKAAMSSSVMQDMRADFHTLPPFTGGNRHYPMKTVAVDPDTGGK